MQPVSLDVALLRLQLPGLVLRPGMQVVARVASRGEGSAGAIVLAGALLKASLPAQVLKGDTLKLTVAETTAERIVLKLDATQPGAAPPPDAPQAQGAAAPAVPLSAPQPPPHLRDADPDGDGGGERRGDRERPSVSLVYETPALGRLDVRLERGPEGVVAVIGVPAGAAGLAGARAESLRRALEARTGAPAVVHIAPRREPFDAYA